MARAFFGGVHPKGEKELSRDAAPVPIRPKTVTIFLSQHIGAPCRPLVRVGDRVTLGQKLGDGEGLCAPVHASVSGTVVAVEPRPHPGGTDMPAVVLENDGKDTLCPTIQKRERPLTLPPDELIAIIREAGITGMGGAGFPTGAKLASGVGKVDTVLVNGAECEPYITADDRLMRQTPERVLGGLRVICRILQPKRAVVGIERKPERGAIIKRNRARLGVSNYTLHIGDALELIHASSVDNLLSSPYGGTPAAQPPHQSEALGKRGEGEMRSLLQKGFLSPSPGGSAPSLPPPDRVFIGGGGRDLPELLAACMERMPPGGIMAASAVTLESFHTLSAWSPDRRTGLCSLNIAHEQPIAGTSHHLKQQNTIYLFTFQKEITS